MHPMHLKHALGGMPGDWLPSPNKAEAESVSLICERNNKVLFTNPKLLNTNSNFLQWPEVMRQVRAQHSTGQPSGQVH